MTISDFDLTTRLYYSYVKTHFVTFLENTKFFKLVASDGLSFYIQHFTVLLIISLYWGHVILCIILTTIINKEQFSGYNSKLITKK